MTAEPASGSASVTWIRVGPGKFVRADANGQVTDPAPTQGGPGTGHPLTDVAVQASSSSEVLVKEDSSSNPPATMAGNEESAVVSGDAVVGSLTEVHGIAPSAFSLVPVAPPSVQGSRLDAAEVDVTPVADCESAVNLGGHTSSDGVRGESLDARGKKSVRQVCIFSRANAQPTSSRNRGFSRRGVRRAPRSRTQTPIGSSLPPNARLQQAVSRAFGRIAHVQRAPRPRSPPYS